MKAQIRIRRDCVAHTDRFLCWSRNILFGIGILALGYYGYVTVDARIYQASQTRQFEQPVRESALASHAGEPSGPPNPDNSSRRQVNVPIVVGFEAHDRPDSVLGKIEIKKIGLNAMILEGTDNLALRRAVGHVRDTALPGQSGNVALAGHRDTFFRDLRRIEKKDEITLTTREGSFSYTVDYSEVVQPDDMEVLGPFSDAILTLVTCYPFAYVGPAPKRFVVRAHRTYE